MKLLLILCLAYVATAQNPCTEEVLRSPEIQAFADPTDRTHYIVCTEVGIFVRMPCAQGTVFNEEINHCVPDGWVKPLCPLGTCENNADCIIDEMRNEYKCLCRVGFTGLRCETNIDECAMEGNNHCAREGGMCVDQINAYYCDFGATIGLTQDTAIPRPCTLEDLSMERQFFEIPSPMSNVFLQCTSENNWTVSKCADMLFWDQELRTCSIEKPRQKTGVCKTYPCRNDGVCEDMGDFAFRCLCKPGFEGDLCEKVVDFCFDAPCGTGRCVPHIGGYNCMCENNIVDKSCGNPVENPCTTAGDYWPVLTNTSRYLSCSLGGIAFVRDCPAGEFWTQSELSCVAPMPEMPEAPRHVRPMMSWPQMSTGYKSYGGYGQEVPRMPPTMETTTMRSSYGGYGQEVPRMPPTMETTTLRTTTPMEYETAPAYGRQEPPRMELETTTPRPAYGRQEPPRMELETTTPRLAYGRQEPPRMELETTTPRPAYGRQEPPRMVFETTTMRPAYGRQEPPRMPMPRMPMPRMPQTVSRPY